MSERTMLQLIRERDTLKAQLASALHVIEAARVYVEDVGAALYPNTKYANLRKAVREWETAQKPDAPYDVNTMTGGVMVHSESDAMQTCVWTEGSDGFEGSGNWDTSCNNTFSIIEGTPSENDMRFCCYCGRPLVEKVYVREPFDDDEEETPSGMLPDAKGE